VGLLRPCPPRLPFFYSVRRVLSSQSKAGIYKIPRPLDSRFLEHHFRIPNPNPCTGTPTPNPEHRTPNPKPRTLKPAPRTLNPEPRILNPKPRAPVP
jgi:hypothetical protein